MSLAIHSSKRYCFEDCKRFIDMCVGKHELHEQISTNEFSSEPYTNFNEISTIFLWNKVIKNSAKRKNSIIALQCDYEMICKQVKLAWKFLTSLMEMTELQPKS